MNPFTKGICRSFQIAMRMALPLLPYRSPELLHSVEEVPTVLRRKGAARVLLVTDQRIRSTGLTAPLERALERAEIACFVYDKTVANPTVDNVEAARKQYLREGCDALIAFGGGSSMDCAKAVGARLACPRKTLEQMSGILRVRRKLPPLIAIPSTAGTGSETTVAAVVTDPATRHKYPISDFPLIPHYAVLDPEVTRSLPPSVTATTGMDALAHAIEAYIGRSTTRETRAQAVETVQLVFQNLERAYQNGEDREARTGMLRAAFLGGSAFTKSYVGYVHAIAHSIGGRYNLPHGLAVAVLLPIVLDAYGPAAEKKLHQLSIAAGLSTPSDSHAVGAKRLVRAIRELNQRMDIPANLPVQWGDIPELASYAAAEANPLYPVPCLWDAGELRQFYEAVMEGAHYHDRDGDPNHRTTAA